MATLGEEERATLLNNLSNFLGEAGDNGAALDASREAVEAYRRLARANPARFEPDLATSLNNLSVRLGEAGDDRAALDVIREAVEIRRRLTGALPARFARDLAQSLYNLTDCLERTGDPAGAEAAMWEANGIIGKRGKVPNVGADEGPGGQTTIYQSLFRVPPFRGNGGLTPGFPPPAGGMGGDVRPVVGSGSRRDRRRSAYRCQ